jgi:hypothetical protein
VPASNPKAVEVFPFSGICFIIATGSDATRSKVSVVLLFSLSKTVNVTLYSHFQGSETLINSGFPSPSLAYLNPSLEVISQR